MEPEGRTAEGGADPAPSPPPTLPTSGSDPLCALRNLLLKQEHHSLQLQAQALPLHKQLYLDHLSGWEMGPRRGLASALRAGILGSRYSEQGLGAAGGAPGGHSSLSSLAWRVQPQDDPSRASKPVLL